VAAVLLIRSYADLRGWIQRFDRSAISIDERL